MHGVGRVNDAEDFAQSPSHSCTKVLCCAHTVQGPATKGAANTFVNGHPVMRVNDTGVHDKATCCGDNQWVAWRCAEDHGVFVEGQAIFAEGDITIHDGDTKNPGKLMHGSENVLVR